MTLLEALADQNLFGRYLRDPETWRAWQAFFAAMFGYPMTPDQLLLFREHTGRFTAPNSPSNEAWLICGRRSGKSLALAIAAVYASCWRDYSKYLGPGEHATSVIVSADRRQAKHTLAFVKGLINGSPLLASMVVAERADSIDLNNRVTIQVGTASFRTSRGFSYAFVAVDELAFFPTDDSAEPDYAVLDALRPGMANIPGSVLLCASSPYARRGALWEAYRKYYAKDDADVLVWKAPTRSMNPTVPQAVIDRAYERDPTSADSEFGGNFRSDIEAFLTREAIEAVTDFGVRERAPLKGQRAVAWCDPSGGSVDSMALAVAYRDGDRQVLACVRERRAPFSPEDCVSEFAQVLKRYGLNSVTGDRYAGEWPREAFRRHGITYKPAELTASAVYQAALPLINSGSVRLLDSPVLLTQLTNLERRVSRGGRDLISHPPNSRDDVGAAACGALVIAAKPEQTLIFATHHIGYARPGESYLPRGDHSTWRRRYLDEHGHPVPPPSPIKAAHDV